MELAPAGGHSPVGPGAAELLLRGKGEWPALAPRHGQELVRGTQGAEWALVGFTPNRNFFPLFLLDGFKILVFFLFYTQQCILFLLGRRGLV